MSPPVFISYARGTSIARAQALHHSLGGPGGQSFLDTTNIDKEEHFPRQLVEALLSARVVVLFVDEAYFQSWYCRWELRAALAPLLALAPGASEEEKKSALAHIVVALPPQSRSTFDLNPLPPPLRLTLWPEADETEQLVQRVHECLRENPAKLAERIDAAGGLEARTRTLLLEESTLPPPVNLAGFQPLHPLHRPPSLGASFVGRAEELWRIHFTLTTLRGGAAGAALTGSALEGGGGFGKTRLALEYLHRLGPRSYPGGIFWIDADVSEERLEAQFHGILGALRPGAIPDLADFRKSQRNAHQELSQALHEAAGRGAILYIIDNVPEPAPGTSRKPLETWCPAVGKVALLVTSRLKVLKVDNLLPLTVETLSPEAAVALLTEGLRRERQEEASWYRLAKWVGYLPLALELMNRAIHAGGVLPEELLAKEEHAGPVGELDQQMEALREQVPPGALRGITEVLNISYERLPEAARRTARLIARLAPEPVPMDLLQALGEEASSAPVRTALRMRHFVRPMEHGTLAMFGGMHRVLADFLCNQSPAPAEELALACQALLRVMTPAACRDVTFWPLLNACLPHAEKVFREQLRWARTPALAERQADLGFSLGILLSEQGLPSKAQAIEEVLLDWTREVLGWEHRSTLVAANNLAHSRLEQGRFPEARELQEKVLKARTRLLGEEHPETLLAKSNLAATLHQQGYPSQAQALYEQALLGQRKVVGEDHPSTLTTRGGLAETLKQQGELLEARKQGELAYEGLKRVLGEEHLQTLQAAHNLAGTILRMNDLPAARSLMERLVETYRRLLVEHPRLFLTLNNLAEVHRRQGDAPKAMDVQEEALNGFKRLLGEGHPNTLSAMNNLAFMLGDQGDFEGARRMFQQALEAALANYGNEHPLTTQSAWGLFNTFQKRGDDTARREVRERHLEWLLKRAPETLHAFQRQIRERLIGGNKS